MILNMLYYIVIVINFALITRASEIFNIFNEYDFKPKNLEKVSPECQQHYNSSSLLTLAAMFDASVKIPNGVGYLNFYHFGDFDECYNLETTTEKDTIYGKYCLGTIALSSVTIYSLVLNKSEIISDIVPRALGTDKDASGLHLGYCIPSGCSAKDLHEILPIVSFDEKYCQSKSTREDLTPGGIATVSIISIFIGIVALQTILDAVLYYTKKKAPHELLIAFSAYSNGKKLITPSSNPDQLLCLNGIKAISMMWVLIGHMYSMIPANTPVGSFAPVINWMQARSSMFILGGTVSVDSFFVAGGIVTVYVFLKSVDKGIKFNLPMYYIHRYLRLTPALGVIIALQATVIDKIGNGPLWPILRSDLGKGCQNYWWSALLYIQNFFILFDKPAICAPQTWYLSVDFQLFLLSPIVLLPLKWKPKIGLIVLGILIGAGVIIPFAISFAYEISAYPTVLSSADVTRTQNSMKLYYNQTHTRFGPYVIGMLLGYFIYKYKKNKLNLKLHPVVCLLIWGLTIGGLIACIFSYFDDMNSYERWRDAFSIALLRNSWAVCVCSVVFMCVTGYGGLINWFLSLPVFQFLAKLSYSMYLVHYAVIVMLNASQKYNVPFSNFYMMWSFWGVFMLTLGLSLILCLTFESPILILEKHIFRIGKSRQNEKNIIEKTDMPVTKSELP